MLRMGCKNASKCYCFSCISLFQSRCAKDGGGLLRIDVIKVFEFVEGESLW